MCMKERERVIFNAVRVKICCMCLLKVLIVGRMIIRRTSQIWCCHLKDDMYPYKSGLKKDRTPRVNPHVKPHVNFPMYSINTV